MREANRLVRAGDGKMVPIAERYRSVFFDGDCVIYDRENGKGWIQSTEYCHLGGEC